MDWGSALVKILPRSRRDLAKNLAAFLAAEIFISPRSRQISPEISVLISPRFWPPRFSSRTRSRQDLCRDLGEIKILAAKNAARSGPRFRPRSLWDENLGGQKRGEISTEISAKISVRWKCRRPKTRRDQYWDLAQDLGEIKILAAKNAARSVPRSRPRSRWDENLGGQKRGEISTEISPKISAR